MKLDMNALRSQALEHLDTLWRPQFAGGGFAENRMDYASIMGTTDAAWIYYMLQAEDKIEKYGADASRWLLRQQKEDGHFYHDIPAEGKPGYRHSCGHAFWMTVRALNIYGYDLQTFPAYLEECLTPDGLNAWFGLSDWHSPSSNHHNVLGLVPLLVSLQNPEWADVFYANLAAQQDEINATWCDNREHKTNVSRTFAYCAMYMAADRTPPFADKLLDTIIKIQQDEGIWETKVEVPEYHTMDACFIIWRLGNRIHYPAEPRMEALARVADAMNAYFASRPIERFESLHHLAANLHTIGLLQEALPQQYKTDIPWRFDWDRADMFRSKAIENH
ncbi:MAG: terpene cyclase/mutase family protein [Clostridia bacterium]|nr:terpene cyclase/mutase family protein [Clostridia bacterium]